jgi:hypothetical protein
MLRYILLFLTTFFSLIVVSQLNTHVINSDFNITDTYIDNVQTSQSYASWNPIEVSVTQNGSTFKVRRILIHFNLSSIPSNAIIQSAKLELNCSTPEIAITNSSLKIERIDPDLNSSLWNAATTNWNNQPITVTSDAISSSTLVNNFRTFDVTSHVRNMYNNIYQNFGWTISTVDENVISKGTYSAENSSIRPKLTIIWYFPYSISSATITHASSSLATNGSINANVVNGPSTPALQWFDGSTPTPTVIPGATTATLSNVKTGWYGLRVTGSHGAPFYMAFLVGINCQNATINFRPDGNYFDDAVTRQMFPESNYGTSTTSDLHRTSLTILGNTSYYNSKTYLKPLIWYDPNITFTSANLNLKGSSHVYLSRTNEAELDRVTQTWNESTLAWSNMPTFSTSTQTLIPATTSTTENKTISILPFVNIWKTNNTQNFGAVLQLQSYANPIAGMSFHSSDATIVSNRPTIDFVFNLNNAAGCTVTDINQLSFSILKDELDASFTRTVLGKFRFHFFEEQTISASKSVPFEIRNQNNIVVASSDINGSVTGSISPIVYTTGNNNCLLDISNVPGLTVGTYFTLIVKNASEEKKYLRIFYQN